MNSLNTNTASFRPAPRFAGFAFAALMTLATLMSVGELADHGTAQGQLAQAAAQQSKA